MPGNLGLPLLTPAQAAKYLAISTRQLRDLTTGGAIRYVNIGRFDRETRRYSPEDLEAFFEERRSRHPSAVVVSPSHLAMVGGKLAFDARLEARSKRRPTRKP